MNFDNANREGAREDLSTKKAYYTLAATTGDVYCGNIADTNAREELNYAGRQAAERDNVRVPKRKSWLHPEESNCFRMAKWTADGRYLVTNSEDSGVRVFGLPSEWSESDEALDPNYVAQLKPYSVVHEPESVYSIGTCPWVLDDPEMNWFITCVRDNPLHLYSLTGKLLSTFILQNANTEKFLAPHSIVFSRQETQFICGTESMISVFDLNKRESICNLRTIPSKKTTSSTQTMKGIISTMDISPDSGVLAAGTFSRQVGLYDQEGSGEVISIFSIAKREDMPFTVKGITDVKWSSCGTYLYVAERKSEKITVWDVRKLYGKVATLTGREAFTVQRMGIDVFLGDGARDTIVGGGMDGSIKLWDVHDDTSPMARWEAHDDPVCAVAVNPAWPGLIASCSGQRNHSRWYSFEDNQPLEMDNTLKLWKYSGQITAHLDVEPEDCGPYPLPDEAVPDIDGEANVEAEPVSDVDTSAHLDIVVTAETIQSTEMTENPVGMNTDAETPGDAVGELTAESTVPEQIVRQEVA